MPQLLKQDYLARCWKTASRNIFFIHQLPFHSFLLFPWKSSAIAAHQVLRFRRRPPLTLLRRLQSETPVSWTTISPSTTGPSRASPQYKNPNSNLTVIWSSLNQKKRSYCALSSVWRIFSKQKVCWRRWRMPTRTSAPSHPNVSHPTSLSYFLKFSTCRRSSWSPYSL